MAYRSPVPSLVALMSLPPGDRALRLSMLRSDHTAALAALEGMPADARAERKRRKHEKVLRMLGHVARAACNDPSFKANLP